MTVIDQVAEAAGFTVFARALRAAAYNDVIGASPHTIFAPTDGAFASSQRASLERLMDGDGALLRAVIGYHFAAGKVLSRRFAGKRIRAATYMGQDLMIDGREGLRVNAANVVEPDIAAGLSILHGIDGVLWPRSAALKQ